MAAVAQPNSYLSPFAQTTYHKQPILLVVLVLFMFTKKISFTKKFSGPSIASISAKNGEFHD
jgi:hypothetical protein